VYPHVTQFEAMALEDERRAQLLAEIRAAQSPRRPRRHSGRLLARLRAAVAPAGAAPCAEDA